MTPRLIIPTAVLALCTAQAVPAASTDTPLAHAEIMKYGMPYPGDRYLELRAIYEPYIRQARFDKARVTRDVSYGPHELNTLDVFVPRNPPEEIMPIVLFVHGGGFVSGDKGGTGGSEIFDNVLNYFARHGMLGININYRLAPANRYPAAQQDIREAIRWIRENAADHGGDPDRVFLVGHSAGASHVATYIFSEALQLENGSDGVAGAMLMSGVYSDTGTNADGHVYFGSNPAAVSDRVPMANLDGRRIPVFVISAEYDPLRMQKEAVDLVSALCDRDGRCPLHQQVAGHNHYSLMYHINTVDDSIAGRMVDFVRREAREAD